MSYIHKKQYVVLSEHGYSSVFIVILALHELHSMITLVHHASVMCGAHGADQNCTIYVNLQCKSSLCWLRLAAFGDKSSSSVWSSSTWLESAESVAAVLQDHLSKTVPEPGAI